MFNSISKILSYYQSQKIEITEFEDLYRLRLYYFETDTAPFREITITKELLKKKLKTISETDLICKK